jgi:hypothetical protein
MKIKISFFQNLYFRYTLVPISLEWDLSLFIKGMMKAAVFPDPVLEPFNLNQ